jgi:Domain of unknown function (DUF4331)
MIRGHRRQVIKNADTNATVFEKPVDNIGFKTLPDYAAYAAAHIYNIEIPACPTHGRVFAGQRKDPFVVNLGETFDLINIANDKTTRMVLHPLSLRCSFLFPTAL